MCSPTSCKGVWSEAMDWDNYLRFVLALLFVLGLIGLLAAVVRKYGIGMGQVPVRRGAARRLKLVEVLPLDAKRRAVLLRRDDVEHLVILGSDGQTVVETGIPSTQDGEQPQFADILDQQKSEDPA